MKKIKSYLKYIIPISIIKKLIIIGLLHSGFSYSQIDRSQIPPSGPDPEIILGIPYEGELENGLKVIIVENNKLPRASFSLFIDSQRYSSKGKSGIGSLTSSLLGKGTKNISKEDFIEEVDFMGSTLNLNATGASGTSLSKYFPRLLELLSDGLLNPIFDQEEFTKERDRLLESIKENEKSVTAIASRVGNIVMYGKDHPYSEFTNEASINQIKFDDLEPFFKERFIPNNAYMVIVGDVDAEQTFNKIESLFKGWEKGKVLDEDISVKTSFDKTEIHFIDMPNAIQSEIRFQNLINMRKNSADYIPLLVANRILGGEPESRLESRIREDKGYAYYARSNFGSSKYASTVFNAFTSSRADVTDSSVIELLTEIDKIKKIKVDDIELRDIKSAYFGDFVRNSESPTTIAQYSVDIKVEELGGNYYKDFLRNVNEVTSEEILNISNNYFKTNKGAIIIAGKGSELIDKLENLTYLGEKFKINYYDTEGNIVSKPNYNLDTNISAENIIENYLDAIGSKQELSKITSIEMRATSNIQGTVLEMYSIKNNQNQSKMEMSAMGMTIAKNVFNKYQGYNEVNGQRIPLSDIELEQAIINSALFSELNYDYSTIELIGLSSVEDEEVYELKITENKSAFYSKVSGLKLKEVETQEVNGNLIINETYFKDYQEIESILLPREINQVSPSIPIPGGITFKVISINLNVETSDSDFN